MCGDLYLTSWALCPLFYYSLLDLPIVLFLPNFPVSPFTEPNCLCACCFLFSVEIRRKKKNPTKTKHRNPVVSVCVVFHKQLFYVLQPHCLHRPNVFIFLLFPTGYCDSFKRCHGVWFKHYIMKAVVFAKKSKGFFFFFSWLCETKISIQAEEHPFKWKGIQSVLETELLLPKEEQFCSLLMYCWVYADIVNPTVHGVHDVFTLCHHIP